MIFKNYLDSLKNNAEDNYITNIIKNLRSTNIKVENFIDLGCYDGATTFKISKVLNAKKITGADGDKDALKLFIKNKKNYSNEIKKSGGGQR